MVMASCKFGIELQSYWLISLKFNVWMETNLDGRRSSWRWIASIQRSTLLVIVSCQSSTRMLATKWSLLLRWSWQERKVWVPNDTRFILSHGSKRIASTFAALNEVFNYEDEFECPVHWLVGDMTECSNAGASPHNRRVGLGAAKLAVRQCLFVPQKVWSHWVAKVGTTWQPHYVREAVFVINTMILTCGWGQWLSWMGAKGWEYVLHCVDDV